MTNIRGKCQLITEIYKSVTACECNYHCVIHSFRITTLVSFYTARKCFIKTRRTVDSLILRKGTVSHLHTDLGLRSEQSTFRKSVNPTEGSYKATESSTSPTFKAVANPIENMWKGNTPPDKG